MGFSWDFPTPKPLQTHDSPTPTILARNCRKTREKSCLWKMRGKAGTSTVPNRGKVVEKIKCLEIYRGRSARKLSEF